MRWNAKQAARWEKTRALGKAHFVFLRGGAGFGFMMAVLLTLWQAWARHTGSVLCKAGINGVAFFCAGVLWGILMWNLLEGAYRTFLSQEELARLG